MLALFSIALPLPRQPVYNGFENIFDAGFFRFFAVARGGMACYEVLLEMRQRL